MTGTRDLMERELLELNDREMIHIKLYPGTVSRHFGIALSNEEAQRFLENDLRVAGDEQGPYLIIKLKDDQPMPFVMDKNTLDFVIRPVPWTYGSQFGVTCFVVRVN